MQEGKITKIVWVAKNFKQINDLWAQNEGINGSRWWWQMGTGWANQISISFSLHFMGTKRNYAIVRREVSLRVTNLARLGRIIYSGPLQTKKENALPLFCVILFNYACNRFVIPILNTEKCEMPGEYMPLSGVIFWEEDHSWKCTIEKWPHKWDEHDLSLLCLSQRRPSSCWFPPATKWSVLPNSRHKVVHPPADFCLSSGISTKRDICFILPTNSSKWGPKWGSLFSDFFRKKCRKIWFWKYT